MGCGLIASMDQRAVIQNTRDMNCNRIPVSHRHATVSRQARDSVPVL